MPDVSRRAELIRILADMIGRARNSQAPAKPHPDQTEIARRCVGNTTRYDREQIVSVLCGINPGFYKAAVGHQFARPCNQFWPALCSAGLTDRLLAPFEEHQLLDLGYYITNLFARTTVQLGSVIDYLSEKPLIAKGW